ncbi:MAG: hypothetical protein H0W16_11645 [Actinobacteria bacterium]|nr:hypothetical protein [Actinomycetota bacterium]
MPTLAEILRVKAWLVLRRNATRDYLDLVALADRIGDTDAARVLRGLDEYYDDQQGDGGRRIATQLAKQLAAPAPYDLSEVDLQHYRKLRPRWCDWQESRAPVARSAWQCSRVSGSPCDIARSTTTRQLR